MKLRNHSLAIYTMLLLGTAAFLGGCVTTGMDRTVKTAATIQDVDNELMSRVHHLTPLSWQDNPI
jgi:hypothetical protein